MYNWMILQQSLFCLAFHVFPVIFFEPWSIYSLDSQSSIWDNSRFQSLRRWTHKWTQIQILHNLSPQFPLLSFKTQPFSPALIAAPFHPGADVVVKSPSHFLHFPFSVLLFLVRFYFSLLLLAFYVVVTKSPFHFLHLPTWRAPLSMLVMSISFHNSTFFSQKVIEKLFLCIWGWQSFRICFVSLLLLFKGNVLIFQAFGGIRFWGNLPRHFLRAWLPCLLKPEAEGTFGCAAPPDYFQIAKYCLHNILTKYVSPLQYSYEILRMILEVFPMLLLLLWLLQSPFQ